MVVYKGIDCYSHHAPKMEWFVQFFNYKDDFDQKHSLGSQIYIFFKRFLRDVGLLDKNGYSYFASVIDGLGLDNTSSWGLMLANLAYTPQINWLIKRVAPHETVKKDSALSLLVSDGVKKRDVNNVWSSYNRILDLPFSEVGLGGGEKEKDRLVSITRTGWRSPDPKVILYSLYKFAEACGDYYQFTLTRLLNHDLESDGVSPTEIFGLERKQMEPLLRGLSFNYPDYINACFASYPDIIILNSEKTSQDVLQLF